MGFGRVLESSGLGLVVCVVSVWGGIIPDTRIRRMSAPPKFRIYQVPGSVPDNYVSGILGTDSVLVVVVLCGGVWGVFCWGCWVLEAARCWTSHSPAHAHTEAQATYENYAGSACQRQTF